MAVYFKPPTGKLSLSTIESCAKARLQFLIKVARCHGNSADMQDVVMDDESVKMADCLTEGSNKDVVSHFLLRLACSVDATMTSFFMEAEGAFFRYRISRMTETELHTLVMTPLHNLAELLFYHQAPLPLALAQVGEMLGDMTFKYDLDTIVHNFVEGRKDTFFVLRFEHVLDLVARRTVKVKRGKAIVPCTRLCDVMYVIFCKVLEHGMGLAKARYSSVIEDDRTFHLFRQLKAMFYRQCHTLHAAPSMFGTVSADDVNFIIDCLPLCMSNLHRVLRKRHRLKHADRIQYTLYLKELGMPVHEALQFWRLEYSQEVACPKGAHDQSWYSSVRRYTYNIRHLYGLEGARTNYRGHSCAALQSRCLGSLEAGGCPFSNCDSAGLRKLLTDVGLQDDKQQAILDLASKKLPQHACQAYLRHKVTSALNVPECFGCDEGCCTKSGFTASHVAKRKLEKDCSCSSGYPLNQPYKMAKSDPNRLFPLKEDQEVKTECGILNDVNAKLSLPSDEEYRYCEHVTESMSALENKYFCTKDHCGTNHSHVLLLQEARPDCTCSRTTLDTHNGQTFNSLGKTLETKVVTSMNFKKDFGVSSCVKKIKIEPVASPNSAKAWTTTNCKGKLNVISCAKKIKIEPGASPNSTKAASPANCKRELDVISCDRKIKIEPGQMHMKFESCRKCGKQARQGTVKPIDKQSESGVASLGSTATKSSVHPRKILVASEQKMDCFSPTRTSLTSSPAFSFSSSSSTSQQVSLFPSKSAKSSSGHCGSCSIKQKLADVRFLKPLNYSLSYHKLIKGLRE